MCRSPPIVVVIHVSVDGYVNTADLVDCLFEPGKVERHIVIGRDTKILKDRGLTCLRSAEMVGRIDLTETVTGDRRSRIARNRQHLYGVGIKIQVGNHEHIRPASGLDDMVLVVVIGIMADNQHVHRAHAGKLVCDRRVLKDVPCEW